MKVFKQSITRPPVVWFLVDHVTDAQPVKVYDREKGRYTDENVLDEDGAPVFAFKPSLFINGTSAGESRVTVKKSITLQPGFYRITDGEVMTSAFALPGRNVAELRPTVSAAEIAIVRPTDFDKLFLSSEEGGAA